MADGGIYGLLEPGVRGLPLLRKAEDRQAHVVSSFPHGIVCPMAARGGYQQWERRWRDWPVLLLAILCAVAGCDGNGDGGTPGPGVSGGGTSTFFGQTEIRDLGTATLPANASLAFQVPVDSTTFMLVADGGRASDIDIAPFVDPLGATWITASFNDLDPIGRTTLQAAGQSVAAGLFPHSTTYSVPLGTYQFSVLNFGSATQSAKVYALLNRRQNFSAGSLIVNVHFCGLNDLNAGNAMANPSFGVLLSEFSRILLQAGIQAQVAGTYDCPASDQTRLAVIDDVDGNQNGLPDELEDLFSQSGIVTTRGLSIFFVQQIDDNDGDASTFIAGIAGGIPGPGPIVGTVQSGVAVAMASNRIGLLSTEALLRRGRTMAHEVGHYLGLFHTTEQCGADATQCEGFTIPIAAFNVDPIPDTPECPTSFDTDGDGQVTADECLAADGLNLMFWTQPSPPQVRDRLTAGQVFVLQRNPLVQ